MEYRRFDDIIVVRMDRGEEIHAELKKLAALEHIALANVNALGAVDSFTVGAFDVKAKQFIPNHFEGIYEIVSLTGSINTMNGEYYAHLHMAASDETGHTVGGHLNEAHISATVEMFVRVINGRVDRRHDEESGLNLFEF